MIAGTQIRTGTLTIEKILNINVLFAKPLEELQKTCTSEPVGV